MGEADNLRRIPMGSIGKFLKKATLEEQIILEAWQKTEEIFENMEGHIPQTPRFFVLTLGVFGTRIKLKSTTGSPESELSCASGLAPRPAFVKADTSMSSSPSFT
jgi:hypothetical protein